MQERGAAAVLGETADPATDLVAIERRIEPHAVVPRLAKAVVSFAHVAGGAIPWSWIRGARIEVEWTQGVDDPSRRQMDLRGADDLLVRAEGQRKPSSVRHPETAALLALDLAVHDTGADHVGAMVPTMEEGAPNSPGRRP
jgi:hypothetical protein